MSHHIILDTSSIIFGLRSMKDIFMYSKMEFPTLDIVISKGTIRELTGLASQATSYSSSAKAALMLLEKNKVEIVDDSSHVDDWIIEEWKKRQCMVCTNDSGLKKKLQALGAFVVTFTKDGRFR